MDARKTAEDVARESYGRLLAYLARRFRDLASAEDALSDAFAAALEQWPSSTVPRDPEGWLLTVAHRKLVDVARRRAVREREDILAALQIDGLAPEARPIGDDRLRLMLVCAHPTIDASVRPGLILQTVLGLDVKAFAPAFLLGTEAMSKRLVRAKAKLRANAVSFEEPDPADMRDRLHTLLEAIYAAYFLGREGSLTEGDARDELRREAVYLGRLVQAALPDEPEALGFLALLVFCEARAVARVDPEGRLVPLLEQSPARWDQELLREGYALLGRASIHDVLGPFQLEAAIQAAHCNRAYVGSTPWRDIARLYALLNAHYPTVGAVVGMAVATAHAEPGTRRGLDLLLAMDRDIVRDYQPWWAAAGHLHALHGERDEAMACLDRARTLATHPRLQRFLTECLTRLRDGSTSASPTTAPGGG